MDLQKLRKKGQVSMEVMAYLGFFMLVFVAVLIFLLSGFNTDISKREFVLAKQTAGQIADDTQFIAKAGPGFWANFSVPQRINGRTYIARFVSSGRLYIDVDDPSGMSFSYPIAVSNIRPGWSGTDNLPNNKYSTYIDSDGIEREAVVVDASKGWIAFNYTNTAQGPQILVK
ncbi:MAG: hypothetical protein V1822_01480 [Candidatus Micrarchaeota archaeon]